MKFHEEQDVVLCSNSLDIGHLKGKKVTIYQTLPSMHANDYIIETGNSKFRVKENELAEINPKYLNFNDGDIVRYIPTNEKVYIVQVDYLYGVCEIEYDDGSMTVISLNSLEVLEDKEVKPC